MRFLADAMLAKLARWLRILGYDTVCATDIPGDDSFLLVISREEGRTLLTKDKELFSRAEAMGLDVVYINGESVEEQIAGLAESGYIDPNTAPDVTICPLCNGALVTTSKKDVKGLVPEIVYRTHETFWMCTNCGQIYWEGNHWKRMKETLEKIKTRIR